MTKCLSVTVSALKACRLSSCELISELCALASWREIIWIQKRIFSRKGAKFAKVRIKKRGTVYRAPFVFQLRDFDRLVVRFLLLQSQVVIMVRFRHRSDAFDDRLPVISLIVAVEDIAIGGAGEDRVATVPGVHRHTFDIGADVIGQATG